MRTTGFPSYEFSPLAGVGYSIALPGSPPAAMQVAFAAQGECHGTTNPVTASTAGSSRAQSPWESFLRPHPRWSTP